MRQRGAELSHPLLRERSFELGSLLRREGIPLRRFETMRAPERQAALYYRGRLPRHGEPGKVVTFALPWLSRHQYGLAEDWVFRVNAAWTWNEPEAGMWDRFDELAASVGLESLEFERPHVQLAGIKTSDLRRGVYPEGGDATWMAALEEAVLRWGPQPRMSRIGKAFPGAPPPPEALDDADTERPVIEAPEGLIYDDERGMCVLATPALR